MTGAALVSLTEIMPPNQGRTKDYAALDIWSGEKLTPKQLLALPHLERGLPYTDVAKLAGVGSSTVAQWMMLVWFKRGVGALQAWHRLAHILAVETRYLSIIDRELRRIDEAGADDSIDDLAWMKLAAPIANPPKQKAAREERRGKAKRRSKMTIEVEED